MIVMMMLTVLTLLAVTDVPVYLVLLEMDLHVVKNSSVRPVVCSIILIMAHMVMKYSFIVDLFGFDDETSRSTSTGTRRTGTRSRTTGTRRTGTGTRSRTTGTRRTGTGTRKTGTGTRSRTGTTHTTRHSSRSRRWAQPPLCIPQLTFGDSSDGTSRTGTTTRASTRRSTQRSTTRRSTQRSTRRSTRKSTKGTRKSTRKGRSANII